MKIKKLSKKQIIIIAVVAVLLIVLVPTGIYCTVNKESPAQMISDVFTDRDDLINKWQSDKAIAAYEFKEDGTYVSYISTFHYTGNYTVEGKKLILTNPGANGRIVYKYNIKGDTLTLELLEENGEKPEDGEKLTYDKVDHINTKSVTDILGDFAKDKQAESDSEDTDD
ncbi:MAG: hypothetical protein E7520_06830 [Ruminococcaceae bacterium]|nr:hypothetical protein [Oscillospiraceae bacterium]